MKVTIYDHDRGRSILELTGLSAIEPWSHDSFHMYRLAEGDEPFGFSWEKYVKVMPGWSVEVVPD